MLHPRKSSLMLYLESNRLTVFELSSDEEKELYVDYATAVRRRRGNVSGFGVLARI